MKKKYPLIFFIVFISLTTRAQFSVYHPFPDSNAYWKESSSSSAIPGSFCASYGYTLSGDTLINGKVHHKLYHVGGYYSSGTICWSTLSHSRSFYGAIREDSMKRVYLCCTTGSTTKDSLLYDFNLKVGDTLKQFNSQVVISYVHSIDSIMVDGAYRKQFVISSNAAQPHQIIDSIIEGIGSLQGLVEPIAPVFEYACWLNCFRQNGNIVLYLNPGAFDDSCQVYGPLGVNEIENPVRSFTIYPNPASTGVTLSYQLNSNNATLKLYNTMGQLLESRTINNNNGTIEDNVSVLSGGVYYYTLSIDGVVEATSKLAIIR